MKDTSCVVLFDDEGGLAYPMGWDGECEGALEGSAPFVVFPSKAEARTAIRISRKHYELRKLQGKITNEDFSPQCRKCILIKPVVFGRP